MRVLIIEDEPSLVTAIESRLLTEGFHVDTASDGSSGQAIAEDGSYDCLVVDLGLPDIDGISILKRIRGRGDVTPVLVLTARDSVEERVRVLNAGADDFVSKPFSLEELLARIRALVRRIRRESAELLTALDLELDTARRSVRRGDRQIDLTPKEFDVLACLLRNKNQLLTRIQIVDSVWHHSFDSSTNIVDVYIRYLRRKIDEGFDRRLIRTVRGMGYRLSDIDP